MIKYIIFDFDGTLANSKAVFVSVYNQIAQKNNYRQIGSENLQYLRTLSMAERCRYLKVPVYKIPFLAGAFLSLYKKSLADIELFAGIRDLLGQLRENGYQAAIISSNAENNIADFLNDQGIDSINGIYCSQGLFGKDKLIKRFLKKYDLKPHEVLYVGDELRDIVACKKTDVKVIWVEWGYDTEQIVTAAKPDYIARNPADIIDFAMRLKQ